MRKALLFAALAVLAPVSAHADDKCGPLQIVNAIQMVPSLNGRVDSVPILFDGGMKYFRFDTGAETTMMGRLTASDLKAIVYQTNTEVFDVTGNISRNAAQVPEFVLGHMKSNRTAFMISPILSTEDGIFGLDYLRSYDVDVDFGADKLNFFSPDHCPGGVLYWTAPAIAVLPMTIEDSSIEVMVNLDGHQIKAELDTGTENTGLREDIAQQVFGLTLGASDTPAVGFLNGDRSLQAHAHIFKNLAFGDVAVNNAHVQIFPDAMNRNTHTEQERHDVKAPELLIGMDVLRKLHVYMAFREKKLYISDASQVAVSDIAPYPADYVADLVLQMDHVIASNSNNSATLGVRCFWRAVLKKDLDAAMADCDKSLNLTPGNVLVRNDRAFILYQKGSYQDALDAYDAVLKDDPYSSDALFMRGHTKQKLGDDAGAKADIDAAKAANPNAEAAYRRYGITD